MKLISISTEEREVRIIVRHAHLLIFTEQGSICESAMKPSGGEKERRHSRPETIWNFLTFRRTNDNSVFHGRATRKRRGDLQDRLVICASPTTSDPWVARAPSPTLYVYAYMYTYYTRVLLLPGDFALSLSLSPFLARFATTESRATEKDNTRFGFYSSSSSSFLSDNASRWRNSVWSIVLSTFPPSSFSSITIAEERGIDESTEGRDCHSICWSRGQLSVFFNQRSEEEEMWLRDVFFLQCSIYKKRRTKKVFLIFSLCYFNYQLH